MSHTLTVESPTLADFRNGAGDDVVVAQCSCGRYEFTTPLESKYWHWLHRTTPNATAYRLLAVLVDRPMPEGWSEPVTSPKTPEPRGCADCSGHGSTEFYGTADGRFYAMGSRRVCAACNGSGGR